MAHQQFLADCQRRAEIVREANVLMEKHGLHAAGWHFEWDRAVRRMGCCNFTKRTVSLSEKLALPARREVVTDTILHEIAHAKAGHKAGHGPLWKVVARSIGCNGERCASAEDVPVLPTRWVGQCPTCGKQFGKHRKPRNLNRVCRSCGLERGRFTYRLAR